MLFRSGIEGGLDMNFFAARFYDPVLARWHSPDPLEQFHSPYLAMCDDPANFTDPDGRAGIPFLQDFMKSNLGQAVAGIAAIASYAVGMGGVTSGISMLGAIGGTMGNIVSGAVSIAAIASSVKSVASLANQGSGVARGGSLSMSNELMNDVNSHGNVGMSFSGARNEGGPNGDQPNSNKSIYSSIRWYTYTIDVNNSRQFWLHEFTPFETAANPPFEPSNQLVGHYLVDSVNDIPEGEIAWLNGDIGVQGIYQMTTDEVEEFKNGINGYGPDIGGIRIVKLFKPIQKFRKSYLRKGLKFYRDFLSKNTKNFSSLMKSQRQARNLALNKLGKNPVKVEKYKWRSANGKWQYRAKPSDIADRHIHLEELDPKTGEVIRNFHLRWE